MWSLAIKLAWFAAVSCLLMEATYAQPPTEAGTKQIKGEKSLDGVATLNVKMAERTKLGENVVVSVVLTNAGKQSMSIVGSGLTCLSIEVRNKGGELAPSTLFGKQLADPLRNFGSVMFHDVPPHKSARIAMNLNHLFDLSLAGKYSVKIQAKFNVKGKSQMVTVDAMDFAIEAAPIAQVIID